jgi:integrase
VTTFKHPRGKTFRFDFQWTPPGASKSTRYTGSTGQLTKADADLVESQIKQRVRQAAFDIAPFDRTRTPSFSVWATEHLRYVKKKGKVTRLDVVEENLRLCLQFFGSRPAKLPDPSAAEPQWRASIAAARARADAAPYHDLRLADPIISPEWIERFEDWLTSLGLSGPRKNQYRSTMSGLYRTALLPAYRAKTNVSTNPFLHIERDHVPERDAVLTIEQLRAWILAAAPHARLAMAIAVYAPELRLASILNLTWRESLNPTLTRIVVQRHKTSGRTHRPQIVPVSPELHELLKLAKAAQPRSKHVVTYQDRKVTRIETTLRNATRRANAVLPKASRFAYGVRGGGITFHAIRRSMATLLAEWGIGDAIRQLLMGHLSLATTKKYEHMAATAKKGPLDSIGTRVPLADVVQGPVQNNRAQPKRNTNKSTPRQSSRSTGTTLARR